MPKTKPRAADRGARVEPPGAASEGAPDAFAGVARSASAPWIVGFCFLGILALALLWFPLSRISARYEINYNEGWNSYAQRAASHGVRIYGQSPGLTYFNYPPISFHLVGLVGRVFNDMTAAGRWVSLLAFFGLALLTGLTVERLTGSRRAAAYSALSLIIFVAALKPDRIGMNDPHLLAMVFSAFGFYAYVRAPESALWLRISAAAFALGLFTKQSMVVFPAAVAVQLLLTSKKRFLTWFGAAFAVCVALLALTFAVDGSHFLEHLSLGRIYSYAVFLSNVAWYLLFFQTGLMVCLVWCFRNRLSSRTSVLVWAFALANVVGLWFSAGEGADMNHLFDAGVALAMIAGVALPYAVRLSELVRFRSTVLGMLLTLPLFLGVLTMLPSHLQEDAAMRASMPQLEQDFGNLVQFVRSRPGPALCESLLLCYEAGKQEQYDPFAVDQLIKTGKMPEAGVLRLLDEHRFSTIQLNVPAGEPVNAAPRLRFSSAFMTRLLNNYQLATRTNSFAVLTPKP
jgi:hypothetical protein